MNLCMFVCVYVRVCVDIQYIQDTCIYMFLMRDEKQASKVKQTNKAKQHSTPKAVTFPRKNELPQVGLEPTTLYTLDRMLYQLSYRGSYMYTALRVVEG